ncbi:MAG: hypothetical protein IJZ42_08235 [Lachnospiraceae bacterium]|nr:hypothetical protein [Lachnospiraceae bacterium]
MKKRLLALVSVVVFTLGMSMTVLAAPSPVASDAPTTYTPSNEAVVTTASGQSISEASLYANLNSTSLTTDVQGASLTNVGPQAAVCLVNKANEVVGANANVVTMVDIQVPEGTGTASFTLNVPSLVAGQSVTVLHLKSATEIEVLPVTAVNNGSVTFTMSSYSPVAVVVNATAPKTADVNMAWVGVLALVSAGGAVILSKKFFA